MKRRAMLLMPALAITASVFEAMAADAGVIKFSQSTDDNAIASGEPFLLDFKSSW